MATTSRARKVIVALNMTSNGVVEFVDDWFDPGDQWDDDLLALQNEHLATEDALVLGRKTFEDFRSYWPHQVDDQTGFTSHMNSVRKYVFSSTIDDPGWENTTVLRGPVRDEIRALKAQPGGDIGVTGSIGVVHALARARLVDEYRLFVYPVLSAKGRNLLPDGAEVVHLDLQESRSFPSGVVFLSYAPATG